MKSECCGTKSKMTDTKNSRCAVSTKKIDYFFRPIGHTQLDNRAQQRGFTEDQIKQERVMERICEPCRLHEAWQQVKQNAASTGIDKVTVEKFESRKPEFIEIISKKLRTGRYHFNPARRVLITKEETARLMKLEIPMVMDRVVSQSESLVFEEIFDPCFTEFNFGFRRGRSQSMAIQHVQEMVREGYKWCPFIKLESFFDEVPHELILKLIRGKIADEQLLTLTSRALKARVTVKGRAEKREKGCPQGAPLSPMLSNIVLNELDQELERLGVRYCRWADDIVILLKTEIAAGRVLKRVTSYLKEHLNLPVNEKKSGVKNIEYVTFLGFRILDGKIRVSEKDRRKFKSKMRELGCWEGPAIGHDTSKIIRFDKTAAKEEVKT